MTAPKGLTADEAARLFVQYGPNTLPQQMGDPAWLRFLRQFKSPLIYILLIALLIDLVVWSFETSPVLPFEAIVIGIILALNAGLGVWQERKAESAIEKLTALTAPTAWVVRDSKLIRLDASELVPGDVIRLESGDRIAADAAAAGLTNFLVDESVVTGESLPVDKEGECELLSGTSVVRGHGYARVTHTGQSSTMGRLAGMLRDVEREVSPLERRLEQFGARVARWVVALSAAILIGGLASQGVAHFREIFLFAVALAVAAVPEGLPAVLTVTLALGVERMARRKAVVRKLAAVESLGSVTIIATDKTGTLTENRMEVRRLDSPDDARAMTAMVLANDADLETGAGDPLERALLDHAASSGIDIARTIADNPRCDARPFDSEWKFMRATCRSHEGTTSYLKGAPEVLLARTSLTHAERDQWRRRIDGYAAEGFRLLALGSSDADSEDEIEWLGLVLLWDPPRPEVAGAVHKARDAGIRVIMITGDHPETARTVAELVGIEHTRIVTGDDLNACETRDAFDALACSGHVLARVGPEHKLRIVEALKRNGEVVAVTGDGVNDAPALKRADVGVAMGERGSDVSREVADLVLLDDNFATIVVAIEEGRSIYENIEKFIRFLFSTNLAEVVVVVGGAFAAFALGALDADGSLLLPLTAAQLLWINLVTDGAPALALALDRNPGVMQHAPRDPASALLNRPSLAYIAVAGSITASLAFVILALLGSIAGQSTGVVRTATFAFLAAGQLLFAYPARHTDLRPPVNIVLHAAVVVGLLIQVVVLVFPPLMVAFDVTALTHVAIVWVASSVLAAWLLAELATRAIWRRRTRPGT